MKKRVLSLFMVLVLCLTLLPTAAFAEGEDVSISGGVIGGGETGGEGGGIYVAPGSPTEGGGGTYIPGEDTRTEIWCVSKPDSIGRGYDGTTDGDTIPIDLTFTDGTNEIKLKEGTGFTAKKTFDSADAGWHKVTVEITLTGETAKKYKLKAGEETFTIGGNINKAYPDLTVSLSKPACTAGEKLLPLLSVSGAPKDAEVTYYYLASALKSWAGSSDVEGSEAMPKIDENTAISDPGTYYVYAKTAETTNYEEDRSATVELTVNEAVVEAASITKADGTDGGTYKSLPAALNAARDGDTVKLLADHVTDADALNALGEDFTFEQYASIVPVVTKTLTLDLNHKTVDYLEVGFTETNEETQKKETLATGNLTVTGEAAYGRISNLMFMAGALDIRSGEIGGSEGAGLVCDVNSGTATISNGMVYGLTVLEGAAVTVNGGSNHAGEWVVASGATLNITDGTFGEVQFTRNGTIAISGGTFQSIKSYIAEELQPLMSLLDTQKVHAFYKGDDVQDGNATELADVTVKEHTHAMVNNKCACGLSCAHTNTEGASTIGKDGKCTVCGTQFAAGIGETYYTDVPSALNAAADGQTVKLLANEMLPDGIYVSKTLTLDLDGHSLSGYSLNVGGRTAMSQVRTGNLTVIDSSGGNGAVGVTVREGGTLVFDPKNDHTTLLQLEVWGGTVELYGGKILRSGLRLNNNITLGDLLPGNAGLAYYRGDTQLTLEEAAAQTCDLVVKSCSHGGKNGFDKNAATCPNCNAPAVAETALNHGEGSRQQRRFADLQTALDADRDGGSTLTLLADVTGDYTIDGTQDTGIDLNGYSIHGTVDVKAVAEGTNNTTTFSNSKDTGSIKTVVAHRGANLAGSGAPAVIGTLEIADTTMWKNLLKEPDRVGFKVRNEDSTHKWYAASECKEAALYNVTIESLPITFKTLYLKVDGKNLTGNSPKVERGTTVQLCASCNTKGADVYIYTGEIVGNNVPTYSQRKAEYQKIGTNWYYVVDLPCNTIGKYSVYFTATKDGYSVTSAPKKLTVTKPNLSNAEITFPNGNEAAFNYWDATGVPTFIVTYKGQTLEKDKDFTITGGDSFSGVGPCTLTIKATDNGDYTGSKSAQWTVRPLKVAASVGDIIKTYDGTTDLPANAKITFKSADSYYTGVPLRLAKGTDYEVSNARYDSADASTEEKTISFTVKLKNKGYVFEDGTTQKDFTLNGADFDDKTFQINKATAPKNNPTGTLNIINGTCQTYTYDFNNILPGLPKGKYGTISYGQADISLVSQSGYYYDETIVEFKKGVLTLAQFYAKDGNMTGKIGTVKVNVTTTNYENFQLKLVLYAVDQIKPVPDGTITASEITYGNELSMSTIMGKMKDSTTGDAVNGTFAWTDGTITPNAGDYEAEWTFTPAAGYEKYATVTETVTIKVNKATPTFNAPTARENLTYTGREQALITAGMTDHGTMQYSLTENGTYSQDIPTGTNAGAYTVWYRVFGDVNHNDTKPASVPVIIGKKPLTITKVACAAKIYDGTANAGIPSVTFDNVTLNRGTDFTVTANFDDAGVGSGKNVSATVTLMGQAAKNYALEQSSFPTTGSITKAAAPTVQPVELTVINGLAKTYLVNLPALPTLETPKAYGALTYEIGEIKLNDGYYTSGAKVENGELTLPIQKNDVETTGSVGTVTVVIKSANYEDITLTVNVSAKNKLSPVLAGTLTLTPIKITYGEPLSKIKITGTMKAGDTVVEGTFSWQLPGDTILGASTSGHDVGWTFTPKDGNTYTEATGTVKVPIAPKSIEGAVITLESADLEYNEAEQSPKITGVTLENWDETGITYITKSGDKATNANDSILLTIEGTGNYTGTATVEWRITPKTVTPTIEVEPCTYTGDALEPTVTVKDDIGNIIDQKEYEIFYSNNTNAGIATVTIKDVEGGNYVLSGASKTFEITKAAAPAAETGSLTITNGLRTTYSLDLSALLPKLTAPCDYGTITYDRKVDTNLGVGSFITLVNGKTGELTLEANRSGTDEGQFGTITVTVSTSNYQDIILTINVIAKNRITPTGTPTLSKNAITYGDALNTIALSGKLHDNVNNVDVDGTFEWVDGTHIPVVGNGTYAAEWIFEPTDTEKYLTVSGRSNITVEKAQPYGKVSMAGYTYGKTPSTPTLTDRTGDLNAQVTYRYAAADSGSVQTWDISNPPALNAGTYRMYASIGDTDNYYGFEAVYCEFVVAKATPTYTVPTGLTAKYGQTLADVTLPDGWSWMDSSESVGGASTAAKTFQAKFTPKDTKNYNTVENIELEVTVNKADGGNLKTVELEQKYTDASDHTYTPDWAGLPAGQDWTFSSEASIVLSKQDFAADGSLLTYAISGGKAGDKITITLKASCDNYEDFTITLNVTLTEKDDQKPLTITGAGSVVYGQTLTLTTTGGSGTGTVTYRIDTDASTGEATIDPETGVLTPVKVGSVSVIATKAGDNDYNDVTSAPFVLMIKPATPTGEPNYTKITTSGKTLKDAALTTKGSTLNPSDGKLEWGDDKGEPLPDDTTVKANTTYKWRFTPDDGNYTTLTGEVELYHKSSSGGGWYDSYYTIKATAGTGGSISPSGSVSVREGRDQTFTITPDKSYAVSNVKIDGKSIGAVKSYTFENVRRTHTIEVIFMKANGNPQTGVFVDVATGSYYEDAVDWAVENGITQGTDDTHFSPDGICTRAQAVTFLWRAAGSPKPETRTMPFTDVPAGSYYYDAVLWAVENDITKGTSDTTFSPNMTCTRAQIVAFLWRSEKSPAAGTANPFADVKSAAYYADAVLWAAKKDITKGTTNTTFSPDADCTRSQIVTFLWRCKK